MNAASKTTPKSASKRSADLFSGVRTLVSGKKKRYTEDGFDLDLTYITSRIIAMGFPSSGAAGLYRNPMPEVKRFFNTKHTNHYKIYNLCAEKTYDISKEFARVEVYPFYDHNASPLLMIGAFCKDAAEFLDEHPENVIGVHCKAGKGRTGLMISALLLHLGLSKDADEALQIFAKERTYNSKGVTIPSQIRYVYYYNEILKQPENVITFPTLRITHVRLITIPNFDPAIAGGGCDPYIVLKCMIPQTNLNLPAREILVYDQYKVGYPKIKKEYPHHHVAELDFSGLNVLVKGDVKFLLKDYDTVGGHDNMCHLWFNTHFVTKNLLVFEKQVIDRAVKDTAQRNFSDQFKVEIYLDHIEEDLDLRLDSAENDGHSSDEDSLDGDADM